ncbi:DUF4242 domain-containing protein [Paenibacillus sp. IB182496]|uniref:DUF4242 domain-containing protein n=1 Tax=Paenibacillus sabuli TaxID=2772509 RepID=A0A927BRL9_9BACL|nr:DUF4242 domain-containing protein [Paenibacillus sabuli]MBD2844269.1 DUF4242 domain-containing protein [Paenibacillus sabuli]
MALYLIEAIVEESARSKQAVQEKLEKFRAALNVRDGDLIEAQVPSDRAKLFVIADVKGEHEAYHALSDADLAVQLVKPVRLVGRELESIKAGAHDVNYLVEWNLPADLTMDRYLARKKANAPNYAKVPEVAFSRTYVCEDMTKCLCFYKAPDEAAVKRAREAVDTPIDTITELDESGER